MEYVLTTLSSVSCDHPSTGGGAVILESTQDVLKIQGTPVLVKSLKDSIINSATCAQQTTTAQPDNIPCNKVLTQSVGFSEVFKVNGLPALLKNSSGETNGKPTYSWSVKDPAQQVLRAD